MRRSIDQMPTRHESMHGTFQGVTDDGRRFDLTVGVRDKRMNSNEMIREHIRTAGRLTTIMKKTTYIELIPEGSHRLEIEVMPNGNYRAGRYAGRTLKDVVQDVMVGVKPRPSPTP